ATPGGTLIVKSFLMSMIAGRWGDARYTQPLQGDNGGLNDISASYNPGQQIYRGSLAELETATSRLASPTTSNLESAERLIQCNFVKWRRVANSLALRYYMRLAEKLASVAKAGIEKIVSNPTQYPIITAVADDVTMAFPGNSNADSWPSNATYDNDSTNYRRI